MKKSLLFLALLLLLVALFVSCGENPDVNDPADDETTFRVMVAEDDGFTISGKNPVEVEAGGTAVFSISVNEGYVFSSVSAGTYDQLTKTLTITNVTERMNVTFSVEKLDYDTSVTYSYVFKGENGDFSSVKSSSSVNAGTLITVTSVNEERLFVGWSFGKNAMSGGEIASTERVFQFRLTPSVVEDGVLYVYANYTDANVYYYDLNGGSLDPESDNMADNDYYTVERSNGKLKVTLTEKYYSYSECACLFWDDGSFTRDGYVLREYNTKADGSGEGYSLGSKFYTVGDGGLPILYCIWEKASDSSDFTYSSYEMENPYSEKYAPDWISSGLIITSYLADDEKVTVPEKINGTPVIAIAASAFTSKKVETLVLPKTIQKIEDGAFVGCSSLTTMYFPDSISYISDAAFDAATYSRFKHLIVNATMAPRYSNTGDGAFAVKLSRLLSARDEKKLIVISGSSTYQGFGTEYMEALLDGKYTVVNFGTTRTRPGLFYLEAMAHYTDEDDIIIYAPENSAFMMGETYINYRMLYEVEGMYNLYRYVDISNYYGYFSSFSELNSVYRFARAERKYEEICNNKNANKYGDYQHANRAQYEYANYIEAYYITFNNRYKSINEGSWNDVDNQAANKDYTDLTNPTWKSIDTPEMIAQVNFAVLAAKSSGAKVYFGFCPADADALVEEAKNAEWLAAYDKMIKDNYCFDGLVGTSADYIYAHRYFYDCAFHLNDYGRTYRTYDLYLDVAEILGLENVKEIFDEGKNFEGCLFENDSDGTPVTKVDFLLPEQ